MNGIMSDIFQNLIGNVYSWIIKPFADLRTLNHLIYGKDGDTDLAYGIFTNKEITDIYMPGMNAFVAIAVTALLVGIVISGMKIASTGINPSNRTYVIEFFKDLLIVGLVLFNLSTLYQVIFGLNYSIINVFQAQQDLMKLPPTLDITKGAIGLLLINLVLLGLWIWANFYYMMRKLTLLLLMIMGPLMIVLYLIPQTKSITAGWLKELIGTVMVQSVHAALYWMIALMSTNTTNGVEAIILYVIFIPVSESLRSLIGLGGQMNDRLTKSAAMFGGAALAGMYGSIRGAMNGKSVAESLRNAAEQANKALGASGGDGKDDKEGSKQLLNNAGTDTGSTTRAERMLKAGEIFSKGGKAVFGAAGAVAGAPMGPMGSIAMSTMGFNSGGVIGGFAGRTGQALAEGGARRAWEGTKAGINKFKGVKNAEALADEKLAQSIADDETTKWADANEGITKSDLKSRFPDASDEQIDRMWNDSKNAKRGEFLEKARGTVGQLKKANGQHAKASNLVDSAVDSLTNDWAKNNKELFMNDYDKKNPLSVNASEGEILKHNQDKESAWQSAVSGKKHAIQNVVSKAATKLGNNVPSDISFINKDDFVNQVGQEVSLVMGIGSREATTAVKGATSSVKNASLYSGKSVNREYLTNQLAGIRTESGKQQFLDKVVDSGSSKQEALQQWNEVEAPKRFQQNLSQIGQSMPRHIPLDHSVIGNTTGRILGASAGPLTSFVTGTTGVKEIGQFIADTRIGQGAVGLVTGLKMGAQQFNISQGVITGTTNGISSTLQTGFSTAVSNFKNHTPSNVIEKQAAFKNAVAYTTGIVGGVTGYKAGASFASGATSVVSRVPGSLNFGFNPYNNAVNKQISEISDIAHMAQTITTGPNGEQTIASGAVRMVTTASQTVIQVRDKTGHVQTVSRMASGDSSLKKGQTIYQDLTVQNGQLVSSSNVYQEDSGGGKVTLNRSINVNPNKIVGNQYTPKSPRLVQEVQSYNQKVDSGQYRVKDAVTEMTNIQMVVDRNRSYMVGTKGGQHYRISQYGPGDARLNTEEVVCRKYEVRNTKLVNTTSHKNSSTEPIDYTNSIEPSILMNPPNKRNANRQQLDKFRHKSFTESLR